MSDTANPIIMGFLFVLRCLIPLGILFGISYLLRRLELVIEHSDQEAEDIVEDESGLADSSGGGEGAAEEKNVTPSRLKTKKKAGGKKKSATSKKKKEA